MEQLQIRSTPTLLVKTKPKEDTQNIFNYRSVKCIKKAVEVLKANLTFLGASIAYVDHSHDYKHFFCVAFYIPWRLEPSKCVLLFCLLTQM